MTTTAFDPNSDQDETAETVEDADQLDFDHQDAGETPEYASEDSADDASGGQAGSKPASGARRPRPSKLSRKQVRSILETRAEVVSADDQARSIAATLLGVEDAADHDGLTVAVVTAERSAARAVESLSSIAEIDEQLDRVLAISTWEKATASSAWKLLYELGLVSRQLPSNNAKAAAAIAKAADELPQALTTVRDLLGR